MFRWTFFSVKYTEHMSIWQIILPQKKKILTKDISLKRVAMYQY
jgi:hypothetical protein